MRSVLLACVVLLCLASVAEAQYYVPNMAQPYGGQWYWTQPVVPYYTYPYYAPYYAPYYGRHYGGYWDRVRDQSRLDWLEFDVETLRRHQRR